MFKQNLRPRTALAKEVRREIKNRDLRFWSMLGSKDWIHSPCQEAKEPLTKRV